MQCGRLARVTAAAADGATDSGLIDRLPAEQKELLQTLAVMGREFPLGLIRRVGQCSDVELDRMIGALQLAEFIYEQPAFLEVKYARNCLVTEFVWPPVPQAVRKRPRVSRPPPSIDELGTSTYL